MTNNSINKAILRLRHNYGMFAFRPIKGKNGVIINLPHIKKRVCFPEGTFSDKIAEKLRSFIKEENIHTEEDRDKKQSKLFS